MCGGLANITKEQKDTLADMGDQIQEDIQQITQAKENAPPPSSNIKPTTTSNISNNTLDKMNKSMAKLEIMMTNFCSSNGNKNRGGGGNNNNNHGDGGNNNNNNKDERRGNRRGPETRD